MAPIFKSASRRSSSSKSARKGKYSIVRIPNKFVDKGTKVVNKKNNSVKK
jgi:hypothetical protein